MKKSYVVRCSTRSGSVPLVLATGVITVPFGRCPSTRLVVGKGNNSVIVLNAMKCCSYILVVVKVMSLE